MVRQSEEKQLQGLKMSLSFKLPIVTPVELVEAHAYDLVQSLVLV